jgi:hypothetical protein
LLLRNEATTTVELFDADRLENKNYSRQNFEPKHIKTRAYKVDCFGADLRLYKYREMWDRNPVAPKSILFCCADNHKARKDAIEFCYERKVEGAIVCGNGYRFAEAYVVLPLWKNTPLDIFRTYPEILHGSAERHSCAGDLNMTDPGEQSLAANFMAAAFAFNLYELWFAHTQKLSDPDLNPVHLKWTPARSTVVTYKEKSKNDEN